MGSGTHFSGLAAVATATTTFRRYGLRSVQATKETLDSVVCQLTSKPRFHHPRLDREWLVTVLLLLLVSCVNRVYCDEYAFIEAVQNKVAASDLGGPPMEHKRSPELSETEIERIQDLVLRGLNITRIPKLSEVSYATEP